MQSQRVIFADRGVARLETFDPPQPAANELLIRTRVSLISPGTERAFFLGMPNTSQKYPQPTGYSNIGQVVALGADVRGWRVGERVASAAHHASHAAIDADACQPVPDAVDDDAAAFFQLAAIALQGVRKARIELGEPVAVIGAGLIGLLALQLARLQGALPAMSVDLDARRLAFAELVGADATLPADDDLLDSLQNVCQAAGAAVVIEATGHPEAIPTAFELAQPGGRVVLLGSTRGETEFVNFYRDVHRKGLTVIGAHNITRPARDSAPGWWTLADDQRVALKLLALGRLAVQPLITDRFPWRDAVQAYELLKRPKPETLGMLLDWQNVPDGS
jgi:2-desacetyl-2-hydroxyethyl bacteriochlorophyllide A dehydrogenase